MRILFVLNAKIKWNVNLFSNTHRVSEVTLYWKENNRFRESRGYKKCEFRNKNNITYLINFL